MLRIAGFDIFRRHAIQGNVQCIGDIPHELANETSDAREHGCNTNQGIRIETLAEHDSSGSADIGRIRKIPCNRTARSHVTQIHDLQRNSNDHCRLHIAHDQADNERRHERPAERVPPERIAHNGTD